ncbi:SDR family oxidoreductase [Brevibacillus humidisoli]|uniref:SDR family oxidoreductase n=1 Tax=Brevibacillus humidisoli TaxID=2895522 RepID=UPI001E2EEF14|nr:SDR family oxidoreductase [Brevibacillus humidisoli]UFJ42589.1 SDR family oxidoreductase [Brevibacillus humidisoli]
MRNKPDNVHSGKRVAFLTGTSSGLGLLSAVALAQAGYHVIATMRNVQQHEQLLREATDVGVQQQIDCRQLDVTNRIAIQEVVSEILSHYGQIDVLVNNAGFALGGFVEEVSLDDWSEQMETNFFGLVAVTKAILPHMRARRQGTIINVSSISGQFGFPGYAPYVSSKYAVEGFSESLRLEMLPFGVHVVLVEPGAYKTSIWLKGFEQIGVSEYSPYRQRLAAILHYSRKSAETAGDPTEVARTIVRIAESRGPKLRYPVGKGVRSTIILKKLLPWKWIEAVVLSKLR